MASENMIRAIHLMVTTNFTQREIAEQLAIREETVSRWKKDEEFIKLKKEKEREFMHDLSSPALRTMEKLLNAGSDMVRYYAASDILNRTGYKPTEKIDMTSDLNIVFEDDYGDGEDDYGDESS